MDAVLPGQSPHFAGESRRLLTVSLKHGDTFFLVTMKKENENRLPQARGYVSVRYRESEAIAFSLEFLIDFDSGERRYDKAIYPSGASVFALEQALPAKPAKEPMRGERCGFL